MEDEQLTAEDKELLDAASGAQRNSYAPYSRLHVGAALRTTTGDVFSACNVENGSYGLTMCAERAAVFSAVAALGVPIIRAIAISASADTCPPCGACRQVLAEFSDEARVLFPMYGEVHITSLAKLLPLTFTSATSSKSGAR